MAIEIRATDEATRTALRKLHDPAAEAALTAERTVVAALGGGCQLPLGAFATFKGADLDLRAIVCSPDGRRAVRARATGTGEDPLGLGQRVASELRAQGADALLDLARDAADPQSAGRD